MTAALWISLAIIIFLLIISALFSATETAFTAASRARLTEIQRRGSWRASLVLKLVGMRERLIGSLLLGNNVANISISALSTLVLVEMFGDSGALIATIFTSILVVIFAEVLPKTYAITYPESVALAVAPLVRAIVAVCGPMMWAVEYIVDKTLKLFGINTSDAHKVFSAQEELRGAIDLHHKEGTVIKKDRDMLGGILDLADLEVADIMIHRTKMTLIDAKETPAAIIQKVLKSGHTRLPVYKDDQDNIIGVLHAKNLFTALQEHDGDSSKIDIEDIVTPPWFVPDTRPLSDQLSSFLRRKVHFALVVDEYGEVQGLITLEDIIEEIVGDIKDEFDAVTTGVTRQADGSYIIDGSVPIRDLNRAFEWNLPDDEATTIAGLLIHEARMIPAVSQIFNFHGFRFEILKKRKYQITSIKLTQINPLPASGEV